MRRAASGAAHCGAALLEPVERRASAGDPQRDRAAFAAWKQRRQSGAREKRLRWRHEREARNHNPHQIGLFDAQRAAGVRGLRVSVPVRVYGVFPGGAPRARSEALKKASLRRASRGLSRPQLA